MREERILLMTIEIWCLYHTNGLYLCTITTTKQWMPVQWTWRRAGRCGKHNNNVAHTRFSNKIPYHIDHTLKSTRIIYKHTHIWAQTHKLCSKCISTISIYSYYIFAHTFSIQYVVWFMLFTVTHFVKTKK